MYISRDVVFDEAVFPFHHMHPNAGALLRHEILLLDPSLHNSEFGHEPMNDSHWKILVLLIPLLAGRRTEAPGENLSQNGAFYELKQLT
jgi:hypothetical protein